MVRLMHDDWKWIRKDKVLYTHLPRGTGGNYEIPVMIASVLGEIRNNNIPNMSPERRSYPTCSVRRPLKRDGPKRCLGLLVIFAWKANIVMPDR